VSLELAGDHMCVETFAGELLDELLIFRRQAASAIDYLGHGLVSTQATPAR
jgi:hypothetical protein